MALLDWIILGMVTLVISVAAYKTQKYTKSVSDFLAANRCAGKYLLGVADGMAGLGAISIVGQFQMYYKSGFTGVWWGAVILPITVIIGMSGWIQYRFRETRALTMAQFFEIRYSRNFRVFAGFTCFTSGIINFGIFPAVGGRFFQYFMGLPVKIVSVFGLEIDLVYAGIMLVLLCISLAFTFMGGQIAIIVTDFLQGSFCNIALVIIGGYLIFSYFDWEQIITAAQSAPSDASLINPLKTGATDNFTPWYFMVQAFVIFFTFMAWQGNQGYYGAAKTPHDARMGRVLGSFRVITQTLPIVLLSMGAYTLLNHIDFKDVAAQVNETMATVAPNLQGQVLVTVAISNILPVGLVGLFAAVMFAAFVSTHDTYLHSWGSIFIQDVVLPVRQMISGSDKPMESRKHMAWLRFSTFGVAGFIFIFSLLFHQKQDIYMFFALTGALFIGWAGSVIIGGLYWKRGNTAGAWASAVVGIALAIIGWYMIYYWQSFDALFGAFVPKTLLSRNFGWDFTTNECPINAQIMTFWSMLATAVTYVVVSLVTGRGRTFNMERMLHRGKYAIEGEHIKESTQIIGLKRLGMSKEFTIGDKVAFIGSYGYIAIFTVIFVVGTVYALSTKGGISDEAWSQFWWIYSLVMIILSALIAVWLTCGGILEMKKMFVALKTAKRDDGDDGSVVSHKKVVDTKEE